MRLDVQEGCGPLWGCARWRIAIGGVHSVLWVDVKLEFVAATIRGGVNKVVFTMSGK